MERGRVGRQIQDGDAFIMPKWIRHIGPIKIVLSSPQRFDAVLRQFMVIRASPCNVGPQDTVLAKQAFAERHERERLWLYCDLRGATEYN